MIVQSARWRHLSGRRQDPVNHSNNDPNAPVAFVAIAVLRLPQSTRPRLAADGPLTLIHPSL